MFALCSVRFNTIFHLDYRPDLRRSDRTQRYARDDARREAQHDTTSRDKRIQRNVLNPRRFYAAYKNSALICLGPLDLISKWQNIGLRFRNSWKYCQIFDAAVCRGNVFQSVASVVALRIEFRLSKLVLYLSMIDRGFFARACVYVYINNIFLNFVYKREMCIYRHSSVVYNILANVKHKTCWKHQSQKRERKYIKKIFHNKYI